jgi:hypothetical protein
MAPIFRGANSGGDPSQQQCLYLMLESGESNITTSRDSRKRIAYE